MKYRLAVLLLILLIVGGMGDTVVYAQNNSDTVSDLEQIIDGVLTWKAEGYSAGSLQALVDDFLSFSATNSGTDWYMLGAGRYKSQVSFKQYLSALDRDRDLTTLTTTDRLRVALTYLALSEEWMDDNSEDKDNKEQQTGRLSFLEGVREEAIADEGINSHIYGLILSTCLDGEQTGSQTQVLIDSLLAAQLADGGFALYGENSDPDVTAMVIQALAPYKEEEEVAGVIETALELLASRQLDGGDYTSWGTQNMETGAQIIIALCELGIDPATDERFMKNGNTLIDGVLQYRQEDKSFSHTITGSANNTSSVQALLSLTAIWRLRQGMSSLYDFDFDTAVENNAEDIDSSGFEDNDAVEDNAEDIENSGFESNNTEKLDDDLINDNNENASLISELTGVQIKQYIILFILVVMIAFLFLWILHRDRRVKDIILIVVVGAAAAIFVWFSNIQTEAEYYQVSLEDITEESLTVTIDINCTVLIGNKENVSADTYTNEKPYNEAGYILEPVKIVLKDGDSVYDLLEKVIKAKHLTMETSGSASNPFDSVYVKAIESIYEKQYGDLSGWMYSVNGEFPSVACTEYQPKDGDVITWAYSLNLGKDVSE